MAQSYLDVRQIKRCECFFDDLNISVLGARLNFCTESVDFFELLESQTDCSTISLGNILKDLCEERVNEIVAWLVQFTNLESLLVSAFCKKIFWRFLKRKKHIAG